MKKILVLSAGKTYHIDLYPYFKNKKKNKFISNYRNDIFKYFTQIYEVLGFSKIKIFSKSKKIYNKNWAKEKSCGSFLKSIIKIKDIHKESLFVSYSDIIFNTEAIENFGSYTEDFAYHVNFLNKQIKKKKELITYDNSKYEFLGLIHFKPKVINYLLSNHQKLYSKFKNKNLSFLVKYLENYFKSKIFINGNVMECTNYKDYINFIFLSKSHALKNLNFKNITINKFLSFTFFEWQKERQQLINRIKLNYNNNLIVRSSASSEDQISGSNAGVFLSLPNIKNSRFPLTKAINKVFDSYKKKANDDYVIVQNMQNNFDLSGVIFSRSVENSNPYFIINAINKKQGDTSSITSGKSDKEIKIIIYKDSKIFPKKFDKLIKYIKFVEEITGIASLDCEFALNKNKTIIFQIRPLLTKNKSIENNLKINISKEVNKLKYYKNKSEEKKILLSVMTDWNPAEIIGKNSFPLSIFLYKYLVLKKNWYVQRLMNGYSIIKDKSLCFQIGNCLYVDIYKSLKSFIPNNINSKLKSKLINLYAEKILRNNHMHDKIESEVVISNLSNCFNKKTSQYCLKAQEKISFQKALKNINIQIKKLIFKNDIILNKLNNKSLKLFKKFKDSYNINDAKRVLNITKKEFILPFAHLARGGFVSKYILNDFFNQKKVDTIISSVKTISSQYRHDINNLSRKKFLKKYFHIVPNTYDFTSVLETQKYSLLNSSKDSKNINNLNIEKFLKNIPKKNLQPLGFQSNNEFIDFIKASIKGREYAKYIFTRNIYLFFLILKNWAKLNNVEYKKVNYINSNIFNLIQKKLPIKKIKDKIIQSQKLYNENNALLLPDFISKIEDLYYFQEINAKPTFIGKSIVSKTICFSRKIKNLKLYKNKIVLIQNADPGYEFLFHLGIKGIITKYGGSNSHMAIRSHELELSSVIGTGHLFDKIKNNESVKIDVVNKVIVNQI